MSLQPQGWYFSHLCDSYHFFWSHEWFEYTVGLALNWSACGVRMHIGEKLSIGIIWLKGKEWNCINLHMMNTWFMHSTWIKTCFDFQPRQEMDLHQFNISWNLTLFVFCWKISTLIHHDAALGILTNDVAKCFLNVTNTKANVLPSFCTHVGDSIIQSASLNLALSDNFFVCLFCFYSIIPLTKTRILVNARCCENVFRF